MTVISSEKTREKGLWLSTSDRIVFYSYPTRSILPADALTRGLLVRMNDLHDTFFAIKEILENGGSGLISPIGSGDRTGINSSLYPEYDIADLVLKVSMRCIILHWLSSTRQAQGLHRRLA